MLYDISGFVNWFVLAQEEEGLKRRRFRHREAKKEKKIREINFSDLKQL